MAAAATATRGDGGGGGAAVAAAVEIRKVKGGGEPQRVPLPTDDGATLTIGRAPTHKLRFTDAAVSANHAELGRAPGGGWSVRDLGSSNGTAIRLAGERIPSRPYACRAGMVLGLGATSAFSFARFRKGVGEHMGRRRTMEDAHVAIDDLPFPAPPPPPPHAAADAAAAATAARRAPPLGFYAVYDGHAGPEASAYCKANLHRHFVSALTALVARRGGAGGAAAASDPSAALDELLPPGADGSPSVADVAEALREAFVATDDAFLNVNGSAGTTAIAVVVTPTHAVAANCGDSRAYIRRRHSGAILRLSVDQKPDRPDETQRIQAAGGWVSHGRVMHMLAVSRAIGDREFKLHPKSEMRMPQIKASLVSAEPEIRVCEVREGDELLLACDGLWDVLSAQQAYEFLEAHGASDHPQGAAQQLAVAADETYHSNDNVTAVYVRLSSP